MQWRGRDLVKLPDAQLVEQGDDTVVGVFGAVVGVNALNRKGKRLDEPFGRQQREALGDDFDTAHELELGHVIDEVDGAASLDAVGVALVSGIDTHIAGLALRSGLAPLADGHRGGSGVVHHDAPAPAGHRPAQIVQMDVRQPRHLRQRAPDQPLVRLACLPSRP